MPRGFAGTSAAENWMDFGLAGRITGNLIRLSHRRCSSQQDEIMTDRFTIDGSDSLEKHLAETCKRVAVGVREIIPNGRLDALLLGGGYGRGQGGVLRTDADDKPYNDLEFYVCLNG